MENRGGGMITTSQTIVALSAALLKFQSEATGVSKDGKNPHFKSKYATLENVIDTARPVLQSSGLAFIQGLGAVSDNTVEVTTRLIHAESGEWMESTLQMPLGKRDPQGTGSAATYGLRYSLMAMLGMPASDDDAETSFERDRQAQNNKGYQDSKSQPANDTQRPPQPKNEESRALFAALQNEMRMNKTQADLGRWWRDPECVELRSKIPIDWMSDLKDQLKEYGATLGVEIKEAAE